MRFLFIFITILCCLDLSAQVKLTYLGNMGVLLEGGRNTVLIDGLHQRYGPAYQYPTDAMVEDLISEGGRYSEIQLSLVTHYHGDHFNSKLSSRLPKSLAIGSEQVASQLASHDFKNVQVVAYGDYQKHRWQHLGIKVDAFRMDHVNLSRHARVQNIGYLVEIAGIKILHVGDTDWYEEMLAALELTKEKIDFAILPLWMLMQDNSKAFLEKYISPVHLVITHIDPSASERQLAPVRGAFPDAWFLRTLGEEIEFK